MLTAAGAWYTSSTFLTIAGIVAVVVMGVLGAFVAWRVGAPRKILVYSMPSPTCLVSSESLGPSRADIQVAYQGAELADPYVATLRLDSRSRRDIRSADFDSGKPLVFDLGAEIMAVVGATPAGPIAQALTITGGTVRLAPLLIRRGTVLRISLLTDGEPQLTCQSPLADVKVEEGKEPVSVFVRASLLDLAGMALVWPLMPFVWWAVLGRPTGVHWVQALAFTGGALLVASIGLIVASGRFTTRRVR